SRNEASPIGGENEDEYSRKKPKRSVDQTTAEDSFEKDIKTLNQPFPKILRSIRNSLHVPSSGLGKNDQAQCNDPAYDHRVADWEAEDAADLFRLLRKAVFLLLSN